MSNKAVQATGSLQASPNERIRRIRDKYQNGDACISVERARYYTQSIQATASQDLSPQVRVATAMKHVYANMTHYVDPDDRIAGYWTEHFLGVPIDIERGIFNTVFSAELSRGKLLRFRTAALTKSLSYMLRKGALRQFLKDQKIANAAGGTALNLKMVTMQDRQINPFQIADNDRRELVRKLLPAWKNKTLVEQLEVRLGEAGLQSEDMKELALAVPGNTSKQVLMLASCATIATIQGHLILDYDAVLARGLQALLTETEDKLLNDSLTCEQRDFCQARKLSLEGVILFAKGLTSAVADKLVSATDPTQQTVLQTILDTCSRVPLQPATGFVDAVQAMWTIKTAVELAHPVNLHCFGRLDQILYPWYQADIDAGKITREEACEYLEELLLKIMSQNLRPESNVLSNFYHRFLGSSPVTLGGVDAQGHDATNELTYLFVEAAHRSKAITNISVRIHPDSPDELLHAVAARLYEGTSSYSLFNDTVNIEAMERRGFSQQDARNYAIMGCVETTCPGKTGSMSANALLLARLLDITLRNGDSRTLAGTLHDDGLATGDPDQFASFEQFVDAFLAQGRFFVEKIVKGSNIRDELYAQILPAPLISAFTDGCTESCRDVTAGGATYDLSGISMINSIANVTDALLVIKKLIFEEKFCAFAELLAAVDANFAGHEKLEEKIRALEGKWGNGSPESDHIAHHIMRSLCDESYKYRSYKDAPFVVYAISMTSHTIDGRLSIASADGRKAATPFAASANPYNVERSGVTGVLRSVAALPGNDLMGAAVNVRFHQSGIGHNRTTRQKWVSLLRSYFALGGSQMQPTVASTHMLRLAQADPEHYQDLIVKVGGYSCYFVDLGKEIQEEIISRTEHCAA